VDSVAVHNGAVQIGVTASNGTLPPGPSKNCFTFNSKAELLAAMQTFESGLTDEQLLFLLISVAYKQDNTMTLATMNAMIGKTVALSLTSGAQLVKVT
jgi:hypothetical protein